MQLATLPGGPSSAPRSTGPSAACAARRRTTSTEGLGLGGFVNAPLVPGSETAIGIPVTNAGLQFRVVAPRTGVNRATIPIRSPGAPACPGAAGTATGATRAGAPRR